ncbi:ABC transporter ATP-binding protein [Hydrocarboniphaga effusa]|jgi:ABC-2 type transport system ATP-binding protein|uniref:ABC transporter ATP-binding protein n=1 Tax=Hydrocarboniphaga effusa TaxID=243629 RepID=UPI003BAA719E
MPAILSADRIVKRYPRVTAVDVLSLDLEEGMCLGLLGPNGAGKSTTIEILEGLVEPTSGSVRFRGKPLDSHYRERVGIQFQATALQDFLTVRENLQFFSSLYKRRAAIDELIHGCHLEDYLDRDHRKLSGGQRQRLLLAIALINEPEIVFLDEPTTGLDPQARRNFWDLVVGIKQRGTTVLLTTHYMEEAYLLSDDIAIMDHGKIIARGTAKKLLDEHFSDSVLELPLDAIEGRNLELPLVRKQDCVEIVSSDVNRTLGQLLSAGFPLAQLKIRPRTLEDLFLRLTGAELRA